MSELALEGFSPGLDIRSFALADLSKDVCATSHLSLRRSVHCPNKAGDPLA